MTEEGRLSVSSANCDTAHIPGHAVYNATHYHNAHITGWPRYTRLHAGYTTLDAAHIAGHATPQYHTPLSTQYCPIITHCPHIYAQSKSQFSNQATNQHN